MAPEKIRSVRKKLRLSQRNAGRRIGGGPNAFQKYNSGDAVLSEAADTVLRFLSKNSKRLDELLGEQYVV